MNEGLSESRIVKAVAEAAAKRIARRVILGLQRMHHTLSGDDSELVTTWDEICVQVQYEQSFFWDAYDETVRAGRGGGRGPSAARKGRPMAQDRRRLGLGL